MPGQVGEKATANKIPLPPNDKGTEVDPDKIVQELREWYNAIVQDGEVQGDPMDNLEEVLVLFDDLDNWIIGGGFLPKEWRR